MSYTTNPIMSVAEARKLLGKEAEDMTDGQIEQLIDDMHVMAKFALQLAREKLAKERLDSQNNRFPSLS